MRGAIAMPRSVLAVVGADKVVERLAVAVIRAVAHRPAAVSAFHKSGKDLRGCRFHFPAAACDLLLHLLKNFLGDNGFVGVFNPQPFLRRLPDFLLVLVGNVGLNAMDAVADVGLILDDALDLSNRPCVAFLLRCVCIDVGECAVASVIQPARSWHLLVQKNPCDFSSPSPVKSKVEDFLYDPSRFLVDYQPVLHIRVSLVSQRCIGKGAFSG